MGFYGASVMIGKLGDVQKCAKDRAPIAFDVNFYAHRLNLVLIGTVKVVPQADDFFSQLEQLHIFSDSAAHEFKNLSETRWLARATPVTMYHYLFESRDFCNRFQAQIKTHVQLLPWVSLVSWTMTSCSFYIYPQTSYLPWKTLRNSKILS